MKIETLCPMSDKRVNKWISRINAGLTFLILILFFYIQNPLIMLFLAVDFSLRGNDRSHYSPLAFISKQILKLLPLKPKSINAGPKFFAARIGWFFSILVLLFLVLKMPLTATVVAGVFAFFAFLEAFFGFCMACYVYPYVFKLAYRFDYKEEV
jgi:predicted cation transporter